MKSEGTAPRARWFGAVPRPTTRQHTGPFRRCLPDDTVVKPTYTKIEAVEHENLNRGTYPTAK